MYYIIYSADSQYCEPTEGQGPQQCLLQRYAYNTAWRKNCFDKNYKFQN